MDAVKETKLEGIALRGRGKVRDIYELEDSLLIVATDRISAFDVVMAEPVPDKGKILTQISDFWFKETADLFPNHLISIDVRDFPQVCQPHRDLLTGRTMWVKKAQPLPVECIVRGYLSGSGWKDYVRTGGVCGRQLPAGLKESDRLPEPLFTPSTKAAGGAHDENIPFARMEALIGKDLAEQVRDASLALYARGAAIAESKGIIIADTKFEFGLLDDRVVLIDEILTPDSSRFWPEDQYRPGGPQMSFDKQYVRDYLSSLDWDHTPPPPPLPTEVVIKTRDKYLEALTRLTGKGLEG
jgi:phosphoribosylaminoimidazole-succinocarboxamide synthase